MVRTRIAVSPTGYPHIGTIYQALFDYAFAKRHQGNFIIRIEDTDRERFVLDGEAELYHAMDWFGLLEDESSRKYGSHSPYVQSERLPLYQKYAEKLLEKGFVYYCFCTKERLDQVRKQQQSEKKPIMYDKYCRNLSPQVIDEKLLEKTSYVLRLKVPENEKITVVDELRGEITFDTNLIDDQVLMKSDGYPTYHLAVVVDDHLMEISHVVRGEEWLPSYPKHILLYRFFSWKHPLFYHTAALRNPDHSKLSKRQGHTSVSWYREAGYLPEAILNYIALLGWSHPEEKEMFSLEEFISLFDLRDLKPLGPVFDLEKLTWMNGEYIRKLSVEELTKRLVTYSPVIEKNFSKETLTSLVLLAQTRMTTLKDFSSLTTHFITEPDTMLSDQEKEVAKSLTEAFKQITGWNKDTILEAMRATLKKQSVKGSVLYKILTGKDKGLPLPESLVILGKEKTLTRLEPLIVNL